MIGKNRLHALALSSCLLTAGTFANAALAQDVNLYTTREPALLNPVLEAFTKDTGIKVNAVFLKDGLQERVRAEGANSPADVMLMVDVGEINAAVEAGITQPVKSDIVDKTVPAQLRPDNNWVTLTKRARIVVVSKDRVQQDAITYEELADPKWKGKICIRSGQHMYNNALFAAMVAKHGEAKAEEWLKGLKANLAQKPSGGDRETARDIAAGKCDLGIGNTYYWALMNDKETDKKAWAEATKVILPTFQGGGTHVNLSGVAIIKTAPNKANAVKFVEWMVSPAAQQMHADLNYEYPIRTGVPVNKTIAGYGALKADSLPLSQIAANRKKASALVDKVGFDN
jgi:iron(III) transport system substrate-binding protein